MEENLAQKKGQIAVAMPMTIIIGLGLPLFTAIFFYISYAANAWFWQDDFGFIASYSGSIQLSQLTDFTNFGRFLTRNAYWHVGVKYFSYNAQYFYIFNFFIIFCTSFLLFKIFEKYGKFSATVAGLFYFLLPGTIESYAWLSNSQHIMGHFFVILFVYLYMTEVVEEARLQKLVHIFQLLLVLVLGFISNIFMSMVLSLPIWMILNKKSRSSNDYVILFAGILLFSVFFIKLSGSQEGAYSTSYDLETLIKNLSFYFGNIGVASIWGLLILVGTVYALKLKHYVAAWFFLASAAFFCPFAFFVHQRYGQYGVLTYLFFLLGCWLLLIVSKYKDHVNLIKWIGLAVVAFLFSKSMEPPIRFFSQNPRGAEQKQQVQFLRWFSAKNPEFKNYCFRSDKETKNTTGVKEWDIPREWWFVGFGKAFSLFVSHEKTYELVHSQARCDVVLVFKDGYLDIAER